MMNTKYALIEEVLKRSCSQWWDAAVEEWELDAILQLNSEEDEGATCLCGHHPIFELCYIKNTINGNRVLVGNCCIKKFDNMTRIRRAVDAAKKGKINAALIDFAYSNHIINAWERSFMLGLWRSRRLTKRQACTFQSIAKKILDNVIETVMV